LILGQTYPNYSRKYGEIACTGGIREDTGEMVRLHPIPERYLQPGSRFHAFQWVDFRIRKDQSDPRPESFRVDASAIEPRELIPASQPEVRRSFLDACPHRFDSLEDLRERQKVSGVSLGIVVPKRIVKCRLRRRPQSERHEWIQKETDLLSQLPLFASELKPIDFPEMEFLVSWECSNGECPGHEMKLLQWGIHELYRKYRSSPHMEERILEAMYRQLDLERRDPYLFLGSFRDHQHNFGLMDSYSPPRKTQRALF
jgi:hypothetical protein